MLRRLMPVTALLAVLIATAAASTAGATQLLPLARGQLRVLLGPSGEWQPQAGLPLTLTLLAGPPRTRHAQSLRAFVAIQPVGQSCARSPAGDHHRLLDLGAIYRDGTLVANQSSPLAPLGGATRGVHAASVNGVELSGKASSVLACTWLDTTARKPARATAQQIPLLGGLFAAAVWAAGTPASAYSLDALSVGNGFAYQTSSEFCGRTSNGPQASVPAGHEAALQVSITSIDCPVDGSTFTFVGPGGTALGTIQYTLTNANAVPAVIGHAGACDLAGVAGMSVAAARRYVATVGCSVGRVLTAPADGALARGTVTAAQVDGGIAPIAPDGTKVDLVTDGR
jgi:hypothetical protein